MSASKKKPLVYLNRLNMDPIPEELQNYFKDAFCFLFYESPELESRKNEIEAMLVFGYPHQAINGQFLDQFPALKVLANHGVGCDHINIPACTSRGIKVGNTPGVLDDGTADMAFAHLLSSARRIREGDIIAHDPSIDSFDTTWFGYQVTGATLGIVGMGRIGIKIAQRALAFKMKILYNKRRRQEESIEKELSAEYYPSLLEMLPKCDFVVLVIPGTKENHKMFSTKEFKAMKRTGIFLNIGRGSVVDQEALSLALTGGTIAAAGIDVTDPEPLPRDHPLLKISNLTITPHTGSATMYTRKKMTELTIDNILCGLAGEPLLCGVN